ncbi:MAG TPA: PspC domain-containing protein [Methanosarcina sp.]|nr:PspC domain-containing protein [Methanosarcina sp.]
MQENPESQEKKVTKEYFFEVPGVPKAESNEETFAKPKGKNEEEASGSNATLEREEPKKRELKPQGELETGYTEESWAKPERDMEEKETSRSPMSEERKLPKESEFKAPGELETGYTRESWAKPQRDMEEKTTVESREKTEDQAAEEAREKVREEAREAGEEAREEKRTTYTMKKRLTKSNKERMLFGVCGGLGEYFGIDPTFIRLAFAALALQGIGIVLYIILAILMPSGEKFEMIPSSGQ